MHKLTSFQSSISVEALQRRLESLDLQDNDYFKAGMEAAVEKAEKNGLVLPEYDPRNYPSKPYVCHSFFNSSILMLTQG